MKLRVSVETSWVGASEVEEIDINGTETPEELEAIAKEIFYGYCSYDFEVIE